MFPLSDVIPSRTTPFVTIGLIAANTIVFAYELQLDAEGMRGFVQAFGAIPMDLRWVTLLTGAFIHDGWIHFGGNMLYLWIFGDNVEDAMGHAAFLAFYLAAAAAGALGHAALHPLSPVPLIGASGAIAAVMGTYFVLYPRSQVLTAVFLILYLDIVEVPALFFLGAWFLLQVVSGVAALGAEAAGGTAFAAHVAGFGAGGVAGLVLRRRTRRWQDATGPRT